MLCLDGFGVGQHGDRPRDARYSGTAASREGDALDRSSEQLVGLGGAAARSVLESAASYEHPLTDDLGSLGGLACELCGARSGRGHHQVEPVEQRAREAISVAGQPLRRARALGGGVAASSARAEVHRADELEARGEHDVTADPSDLDGAVLEWLPESLEDGSRELGELVEQQHPVMGKAGLARPRPATAADDSCGRGRVVRRAERGEAHERSARGQEADDRVDARHLERLVVVERGQDPRKSAREHRLAGPRRPGEQQVVTPRRGELERASRPLLAAHVCQVGRARDGPVLPRGLGTGRRPPLAPQVRHRLGEMSKGDRLDAGERNLEPGLGRAEESREAGATGALRRRERTAHWAQPAVEGELADRGVPREPVGRDLTRGGEHCERDRQVEPRSLLAELGRGQVDGDPTVRPLELGRRDPAPNPLLRLLTGAVGEADDREGRHPELEMRFDLDPPRVESHERVGDRASEHPPTLAGEPCRTVTRECRKRNTAAVEWIRVDEQPRYSGFRTIVTRRYLTPDGVERDFDIKVEEDTAVVVALTPGEEVVLVREYRPGPEASLLELPGGGVAPGEDPLEAARRELLEETGYEGKLRFVGSMADCAYSTRTRHTFAATNAQQVQAPAPHEGEFPEVVLLSLSDFRNHLRSGRLTDVGPGYLALDALTRLERR
jgi:ADP-ribose pyrophosphatase